MTTLILRIQNNDGKGYLSCKNRWSSDDDDKTLSDGSERWMHPDVDQSELGMKYKTLKDTHLYGFANKKDLFIWFLPQELGKLYCYGYNVYLYKVKNEGIIYGSKQLIFYPEFIISSMLLNSRQLRKL